MVILLASCAHQRVVTYEVIHGSLEAAMFHQVVSSKEAELNACVSENQTAAVQLVIYPSGHVAAVKVFDGKLDPNEVACVRHHLIRLIFPETKNHTKVLVRAPLVLEAKETD